MFQSTQCLTFRTITSLGHFKIHQPLPLTSRQSKQLLNLLTTSFRRQLDREHGILGLEAEPSQDAKVVESLSKSATRKARQNLASKSDYRIPTDRHLHAVLTNPLLSNAVQEADSSNIPLRDPMEIFDEACAKGFMKLEYATACLKAKKNRIMKSSALSLRDAMKSSGAGSRTLQWMSSSGIVKDGLFMQDEAFSEILVEFLVAEGLQPIIWMWLDTLYTKVASTSTQSLTNSLVKDASRLLRDLVKAETSGFESLDNAFNSVGKAKDMISYSRHEPLLLKRTVDYLFTKIVHQHALQAASSPKMFDLFISIVTSLALRNQSSLSHLKLYHPSNPDAKPALEYLQKARTIASAASHAEEQRELLTKNKFFSSRTIYLGLDTARFLLEREQHKEAEWIMKFLGEIYGKQLGISQVDLVSQIEQVQAEASSIELLNSLNLA